MSLAAGTRLGPYEILALIGAGGMGEVYRGRDTKLERDVAIKVLPEAVAQNPERLARFEREAKVLAALNHPNIAQIYGVEGQALIMELVEGETLAGPLPLDTALDYARQMASALEAAHEKGIVHRDLKPANVKVTPQGVVKVLDFGLAAIVQSSAPSETNATQSPTLTLGATQMGMLLGTAAYMSPEQARGKPVDKRADIWAFGVVLYEMLTGRQLFHGEDISHTLAAVIMQEPDLEAVPPKVRRVLRRCLEKDPNKRLRDISGVELLLEAPENAPAAATDVPRPWVRHAGWIAAGVMTVVAAAIAVVHFREQPEPRQVLQYTLPAAEKISDVESFALSPNGRYLVMRAAGEGGVQLWVRALDSLQAQPLGGTVNANYPFWSPDSRYIGFFADGKLKKIAVTGGPAQILCDAPTPRGGTWNQNGVILFAPENIGGLSRVSAQGGVPVPVTKGESHRKPAFLPDGRRFLYVATLEAKNGIYVGSLDSRDTRRLTGDVSEASYFEGHLLFVRSGTLIAQPVDAKTLDPKGDLFPVAQQLAPGRNAGDEQYSISANGVLVYQRGTGHSRRLVWFDRTGREVGSATSPFAGAPLTNFALSPDGKRVVTEREAPEIGNSDLWITDLERGTEQRFTFDRSRNQDPVWSPDGSTVAFTSNRGGSGGNLYQRAANGAGQDELLFSSRETKRPADWSRDGRFLIFLGLAAKPFDLWALPLAGERKPIRLLQSENNKFAGQVSPDGKWLAYTSQDTGRPEVYVVPFGPGSEKRTTGKWQISKAGGVQARWRADGKELFYVAPDRKLMAVEVTATPQGFEFATADALFDPPSDTPADAVAVWGYAPSANGKRFLIGTTATPNREAPSLTVVVNWLAGVRK